MGADSPDQITPAAFTALVLRHGLLTDSAGRPVYAPPDQAGAVAAVSDPGGGGGGDAAGGSARRLQRSRGSMVRGVKDPRMYSQALAASHAVAAVVRQPMA